MCSASSLRSRPPPLFGPRSSSDPSPRFSRLPGRPLLAAHSLPCVLSTRGGWPACIAYPVTILIPAVVRSVELSSSGHPTRALPFPPPFPAHPSRVPLLRASLPSSPCPNVRPFTSRAHLTFVFALLINFRTCLISCCTLHGGSSTRRPVVAPRLATPLLRIRAGGVLVHGPTARAQPSCVLCPCVTLGALRRKQPAPPPGAPPSSAVRMSPRPVVRLCRVEHTPSAASASSRRSDPAHLSPRPSSPVASFLRGRRPVSLALSPSSVAPPRRAHEALRRRRSRTSPASARLAPRASLSPLLPSRVLGPRPRCPPTSPALSFLWLIVAVPPSSSRFIQSRFSCPPPLLQLHWLSRTALTQLPTLSATHHLQQKVGECAQD